MCAHAYEHVPVCACFCVYMQMPAETRGIRSPGVGVSGSCDYQIWALGTKPRSSAGAGNALNC